MKRALASCVFVFVSNPLFASEVVWSHQFKFELESSSFHSCATSALQASPGILSVVASLPPGAVGFSYPIAGSTVLRGVVTQLPDGFASIALYGTGATEPKRLKMMLPRVLYDISSQIRERCQS